LPDRTRAPATCVIGPDGTQVVRLDYGRVGVVAADVELDAADRSLALRWAPQRNALAEQEPADVH
jgi:hypothetical protein